MALYGPYLLTHSLPSSADATMIYNILVQGCLPSMKTTGATSASAAIHTLVSKVYPQVGVGKQSKANQNKPKQKRVVSISRSRHPTFIDNIQLNGFDSKLKRLFFFSPPHWASTVSGRLNLTEYFLKPTLRQAGAAPSGRKMGSRRSSGADTSSPAAPSNPHSPEVRSRNSGSTLSPLLPRVFQKPEMF